MVKQLPSLLRLGIRAVGLSLLALAVEATVASAWPAHPNSLNTHPSMADVTFAYEEALTVWGGPPPLCASVDLRLEPPDYFPDARGQATQPTQPDTACELAINEAIDLCELPSTMRHEVGHLHGFGHSEYAKDWMHSPSPTFFCQRERERRVVRKTRGCGCWILRISSRWGREAREAIEEADRWAATEVLLRD